MENRKHNRDPQRGTLVKSGALRRSIKAVARGMSITVSSSLPYAKAHNEGFSGVVTDSVSAYSRKAHTRKAHSRQGRQVASVNVKAHSVGAFTRKRKMVLPKRQFLGSSTALWREIDTLIDKVVKEAIRTQ